MFRRSLTSLIAALGSLLFLLSLFSLLTQTTPVARAVPQLPSACTEITSDIASDTTWTDACYHIPASTTIHVQTGVTLTIAPLTSTQVNFDPSSELVVDGNLLSLGASDRPITFTATNPISGWYGLRVSSGQHLFRIQYSTIEAACAAVNSEDSDYLEILTSSLRFNGDGSGRACTLAGNFGGAIGGDADSALIRNNTIYSSTNGLALNESFNNQIFDNTFRDISGYGVAFLQTTPGGVPVAGGNDNEISRNIISGTNIGLRLERGTGNLVLSNSIYLNTSGAIYLAEQNSASIQYNHVYSNGGGVGYQASIFVTGTDSIPLIQHNVLLDNTADALAFDANADNSFSLLTVGRGNAFCSLPAYELRNSSPIAISAPGNWWSTNVPVAGVNTIGSVSITDPIVLSATLGANLLPADSSISTIITLTFRDSLNQTTIPPNRSGDPDARRITLQTSLGSLNPPTVEVNDQGVATATLTSAPSIGLGVITVTAFCNFPLTVTYQLTHTNVAITKSSVVTQVLIGSNVTYTIVYTTGAIDAPNVTLTDTLPTGMIYVGDNSGFTPHSSGNQITWTASLLPPAFSASFVLTASIPTVSSSCGLLGPNLISIGTSAIESTYADNTAASTAINSLCADWALSKTADRSSGPLGDPITYTIVYSNASANALAGAIITDQLPANTVYVADTSGLPLINSGGLLTWTQPIILAPGTSYSFLLRLNYTDTTNNVVLINSACISSPMFDSQPNNNCAQATYLVQSLTDLVVIKDDDVGPVSLARSIGHKATAFKLIDPLSPALHRPYVNAGDIVTYTIAVVNVGNSTATNVVLTETLPLYMDYRGSGWQFGGGSTYTRSVGTLNPGDGRIYYFVTQVTTSLPSSVSTLINLVCGFSQEGDLNPDDNCHIEDTPTSNPIVPTAHLTYLPIVMKNSVASALAFSQSTYRVSESKRAAVITVTLNQPLPVAVMVDYETNANTAWADIDYTSTLGTLIFAPGTTVLTFTVQIISDTLMEYDESLWLILSNPVNASIGLPNPATLIIQDDDFCITPMTSIVSLYSPMDVAYEPSTDRLFIANRDGPFGGSLTTATISPTSISKVVTGVLSAQGVAYDAARHRLYVAGWDWLNVIDSNAYTVVTTITLGTTEVKAHNVAYNPVSQKIYVTGFGDNSITIIDANTLNILARIDDTLAHPLREPSYIAVLTSTGKVYVTNHNNGRPGGWITIINGSTNSVVKTLYPDPGGELYGIAADNVHNRIYAASINAAAIYAIDGATDTQLGYFQVISYITGDTVPLRMIDINPDPGLGGAIRLWATTSSTEDAGRDQLIAITGNWPAMDSPFRAADLPPSPERGLRFDPTTKYVIAASAASNVVNVLRDAPETFQCMWQLRPQSPEYKIVVHDFAIEK
jgi:uncharacterized repeat protein (TIGR01451 family)